MEFTKIVGVTIVSVLLLSFWQSWAHSMRGGEALIGQGWWSARHDSACVAPDPVRWRDTAIVQVYATPTYGWLPRAAAFRFRFWGRWASRWRWKKVWK